MSVASVRSNEPDSREVRVGIGDPLSGGRPVEIRARVACDDASVGAVSTDDRDPGLPGGGGAEGICQRSPVWRPARVRPPVRAEANDRPHPAGGLRDADDPPVADQVGELAAVWRECHLRAWCAEDAQVRAIAVHDRRATNVTYRELAGRTGGWRCRYAGRLPSGALPRTGVPVGVVKADEPDSCRAKESTRAVTPASASRALSRLLDQRFTIVRLSEVWSAGNVWRV